MKPIREKWAGTMTDRQRFLAQMHYRPVDRCFHMEWGYWDENFAEWPMFRDNGIANRLDADESFGFDSFGTWYNDLEVRCATGMNPKFAEEAIGETESNRIFINEDGVLAEAPKDNHQTIPHYIRPSVVTPEDWKRVKEERFRRDDPARRVDIEALRKRHPGNRDYPICIFCGSMIGYIRNMLTVEGLAYACADYPDMVEDMVETHCALTEDLLDQVLPHIDFDYASGWEDICFKNGPLVSVGFFKSVIAPRYRRIGKKLKAAGIDLWYMDCDGDVRAILPHLFESGVNCLFPYEACCCGHPIELMKEYGKELRIFGGVDKRQLIAGRDATKRYLESLVPAVERGGYIPFLDHECPPDVRQEDYLYYLDLKEELFNRPLSF